MLYGEIIIISPLFLTLGGVIGVPLRAFVNKLA